MINPIPDSESVVPITSNILSKSEKTIPVPKIKQTHPDKIKFLRKYCMITN